MYCEVGVGMFTSCLIVDAACRDSLMPLISPFGAFCDVLFGFVLTVMSGRRWLICKGGTLQYGHTNVVGATKKSIALLHAHLGQPSHIRDRPHCWQLTVGEAQGLVGDKLTAKEYTLAVDSTAEKAEWVRVLRVNIAIASGSPIPTLDASKIKSSIRSPRAGSPAQAVLSSTSSMSSEIADSNSKGQAYQCLGCSYQFVMPKLEMTAEACPKCQSNFLIEA